MKKKSLLITAIAIFGFAIVSMAQTVPSYVPTSGLVGWWPFNGNANDESGNGHNGTPMGGVSLTLDRNGVPNTAYSFDGIDDYIISPTATGYVSDTISLSFWINYNADFSYFSLIAFGGSPSIRWGAACGYTTLRATVGSVCGGTGSVLSYTTSAGWHNVVYVIAGTSQDIYYDGIYVGTESNSLMSSLSCDISNLWFGVDIASAAEYYNGKLDDIGIWNRALDSCEIKDLYFARPGSCCHISVSNQPTNSSTTISNTAQFTIASSDSSATYQWQSDLGVGFQNINSVGQYSGSNKDTLRVANVTMGNNNQPFRCIVSSGACSDTSNAAVLTVINANGINETSANNLFTVYPNPAKSQINVKADATLIGSSYTVYNNIGKVTLTGKINAENTVIDLGHLSSGVYLFSIGDSLKQRFTVVKE